VYAEAARFMKCPRVLAAVSFLAVHAAEASPPGEALGPASMESYPQTILVTFKSEEAARRARLQIAPLYHDFRAAFSTRMDDSTLNDLRAAEVMGSFGQKGTFYLNDPRSWYQDSPETGIVLPSNPSEVIPRRLLADGNSIGGHTLAHEMLPALSKNAAFREIMGIRVTLETRVATPVNSFVYPFVDFESALRDGTDRADLEEMIRRAGFYQLAEHRYNTDWDSGFQDGIFITLDNDSGGGRYSESVLTQARCEADRPLFLVTMHAWVRAWGAPGFPKLAAIYGRWSKREDWWYCNQNQYAAYRYQALHSRLATVVEGNTLRATLRRPSPLDLNDWTPLTFKVDGVSKVDPVSVSSPMAETRALTLGESFAFDLFHDRDRGPMETYAETGAAYGQPRGPSGGAEGLEAHLQRKEGILSLLLHNGGPQPLHGIRVVFRLPLRWQEGVVRREVGTLDAGASVAVEADLAERPDAADYSDGTEYDVAQVDFKGSRRARLYAVRESAAEGPAPFFARDGFWVLGPLPGDKANFDPYAFSAPFMDGRRPETSYSVPWVGSIAWKVLPAARAAILDPDIIPTTGKANTPDNYPFDPSIYFPHKNAHYLLLGRIVSPRDQAVRVVCRRESVRRLSLNGRKVEGDELDLRKGGNDVRILYAPAQDAGSTFLEANYGCYFRLRNADGSRAEDLRFERPAKP
jgi:peptidoglycan/xylan/chitin deacetylase (PgdA/CDA1 family)